jgi:hypothetical protein
MFHQVGKAVPQACFINSSCALTMKASAGPGTDRVQWRCLGHAEPFIDLFQDHWALGKMPRPQVTLPDYPLGVGNNWAICITFLIAAFQVSMKPVTSLPVAVPGHHKCRTSVLELGASF